MPCYLLTANLLGAVIPRGLGLASQKRKKNGGGFAVSTHAIGGRRAQTASWTKKTGLKRKPVSPASDWLSQPSNPVGKNGAPARVCSCAVSVRQAGISKRPRVELGGHELGATSFSFPDIDRVPWSSLVVSTIYFLFIFRPFLFPAMRNSGQELLLLLLPYVCSLVAPAAEGPQGLQRRVKVAGSLIGSRDEAARPQPFGRHAVGQLERQARMAL